MEVFCSMVTKVNAYDLYITQKERCEKYSITISSKETEIEYVKSI